MHLEPVPVYIAIDIVLFVKTTQPHSDGLDTTFQIVLVEASASQKP